MVQSQEPTRGAAERDCREVLRRVVPNPRLPPHRNFYEVARREAQPLRRAAHWARRVKADVARDRVGGGIDARRHTNIMRLRAAGAKTTPGLRPVSSSVIFRGDDLTFENRLDPVLERAAKPF